MFQITRLVLSLLSLALLGLGLYLAWSWWDGRWVARADGDLVHVRDTWRLVTAIALLAWSFLGRFAVVPLLARRDDRPFEPKRFAGAELKSPTGSTLHLEASGPTTAPTVILTHGWGLDSTIWRRTVERLDDQYRVVVWDLPGLGRSRAAGGQTISPTAFARDLLAIIQHVEGPVILVGHSIGGITLQTLVRDHADAFGGRVAGLVLVNTTHTNPLRTMALAPFALALRWPVAEPSLWLTTLLSPLAQLSGWQSYLSGAAQIANRLGFSGRVTRSELDYTALLTVRNSQGASARGNLAMFRWDATGAMSGYDGPVLVLAGDKDLVTRPDASARIATETPGAILRTMPTANHMGFLDHDEAYNDAIVGFCDQCFQAVRPGVAVG